MKCFTNSEASQHISAIQNAFKNNFKTICNALMPDMNTSHIYNARGMQIQTIHKWFMSK